MKSKKKIILMVVLIFIVVVIAIFLKKTTAIEKSVSTIKNIFLSGDINTLATENEAQIGSQGYATLEDALAVAKNGEEIDLLKDVERDTEIIVPEKTDAIIDLNGFSINNTAVTSTNNSYSLSLELIEKLTIKDSGNSGTINGINVKSAYTSSEVNIGEKDGKANTTPIIDKCNFGVGIVNFYDGILREFDKKNSHIDGTEVGYKPKINGTELILEKSNTVEAKIEGKEYYAIENAISDTTASQTIQILNDITRDFTITIQKDVIIDLNGKNIVSKEEECINNDGIHNRLLIKNSDSMGNGKIEGSNGIENSSELIIKGVNIVGRSYDGIWGRASNITIEGGEISGKRYGILLNNCSVTLGKKDSDVSTTSPVISGGTYGIYNGTRTFNFYDGKVIGNTEPIRSAVGVSDKPDGYEVVVEGNTATLQPRHTIKYTVEYYTSSTENYTQKEDKTETVPTTQTTLTVDRTSISGKTFDGYKFSKATVNGTEYNSITKLPESVEDGTVIKVYYTKRTDLKYKIEYYYNGIKENEEEIENQTYQEEITRTAIEPKIETNKKDGYRLAKEDEIKDLNGKTVDNGVVGTPLTISTVENNNIIKVYYMPDENQKHQIQYTVEYYLGENPEAVLSEAETQEVQKLITKLTVDKEKISSKKYDGYKLLKIVVTEGLEPEREFGSIESLEEEVENNAIIKVYFVPDEAQKKDLRYTIEFYKDGIEEVGDRFIDEKVVQVLEQNDLQVRKDKIQEDKYDEYELKRITITYPGVAEAEIGKDAIPDSVVTETVIKVYYENKYHNIGYKIEIYKGKVETATETEEITEKVEKAQTKLTLDRSKIEETKYEGYKIAKVILEVGKQIKEYKTLADVPVEVENGTTVKVYYLRKASVRVKHIDKETNRELVSDEIIEGVEGEEYKTKAQSITGYMYDSIIGNAEGQMQVVENPDGTTNIETLVQYFYTKIKESEVNPPSGNNDGNNQGTGSSPNESNTLQESLSKLIKKKNNKKSINNENGVDTSDKTPVIAVSVIILVISINILVILIRRKIKNKKE